MSINLELYENFDGSLDGRYKQGDKPSSPTLLRVVSFDGLSNGQSVVDTANDQGSVEGKRLDGVLGNKGFVNGYGVQAQTSETYNGATSAMKVSIASGSDGDPAGGGTGASYGAFGGSLSLGADAVAEGEELWVGSRIKFPVGFNFNTNIDVLKFIRFGVVGHSFVDQHILESTGVQTGWTLSNENDPMVQADTRRATRNTFTLGDWHWVEVYIKPSSNGLLTERRIWLDGVLQFERVGTANKWLNGSGVYESAEIVQADGDSIFPASDDVIGSVLFFTYWNGNSPQNQELYIQNIALHKDASTLTQVDSFGNKIIGGL